MKLKFIIIPSVILLVMYMAFAQTSYISAIVNNISIGNAFEIFVDTTNNRVGIGNSIPNGTLHVSGNANITGDVWVANRNLTRLTPDFQRFTTTGTTLTWTKPSNAKIIMIELIGAGGGGGGGTGNLASGNDKSGGGGGGGALVWGVYSAVGTCAAGHTDNGDGTCTATFQPGGSGIDSYMVAGGGADTNYETSAAMEIGTDGTGTDRRGLIKFDLSSISPGVTVTDVTLSLYETAAPVDTARNGVLRRLLENWIESQITWNIYSTGNSWATAGASGAADVSATTSATTALSQNTNPVSPALQRSWSSAQLTADVQDMIDDSDSNYGWRLHSSVEGTTSLQNHFRSSDHGTAGERPKLVVTYTPATLPTLKISVGAGGSGGAGGASSGANGADGGVGGNTYVNSTTDFNLTAYGGGGGVGGIDNVNVGGGGGGGTGSAGATGSSGTGGNGGNPTIQGSTQGDSLGGRGGKGGNGDLAGGNAEYGGGGGGGGNDGEGGGSLYGAGGGSGAHIGTAGGAWGEYTDGGGGATGSTGASPTAGTAGTGRNYGAGDGGGGGGRSTGANTGGAGGGGGAPGGGGGGGGNSASGTGGAAGTGARGEVRIWSW